MGRGEAALADQHRVASMQEAGVAFGQAQAQDIVFDRDGRHRFARQHHRAIDDLDLEHPARGRGQDIAFALLLFDHRPFGGHGRDLRPRHIHRRPGVVQPLLRAGAAGAELQGAIQFQFGLMLLGLKRPDAGLQRGELQRQFGIAHGRDHLPGFDPVAFLDAQVGDGAADARAGHGLIDRLDRGEHGLEIVDRLQPRGDPGCRGIGAGDRRPGKHHRQSQRRKYSRTGHDQPPRKSCRAGLIINLVHANIMFNDGSRDAAMQKGDGDMSIDRIVMAFAGSMILVSLALSQLHSPDWLWLAAFVGANLLQAAFTGFCPLAIVLKKLGVRPGAAFG
jgi:hypothetical protein